MAHYKRKKPRRQVKCTLCTDARTGNSNRGGKRARVGLSQMPRLARKKLAEKEIEL